MQIKKPRKVFQRQKKYFGQLLSAQAPKSNFKYTTVILNSKTILIIFALA